MRDPEMLLIHRYIDLGDCTVSRWKLGQYECWGLECGWNDGQNRPFLDAIPEGEYRLEPHGGEKYKDTLAFVSEALGVSHFETPEAQRYACVIHHARNASYLTGCLAPGTALALEYGRVVLGASAVATQHVLSALRWPGLKRALIENRWGGYP